MRVWAGDLALAHRRDRPACGLQLFWIAPLAAWLAEAAAVEDEVLNERGGRDRHLPVGRRLHHLMNHRAAHEEQAGADLGRDYQPTHQGDHTNRSRIHGPLRRSQDSWKRTVSLFTIHDPPRR